MRQKVLRFVAFAETRSILIIFKVVFVVDVDSIEVHLVDQVHKTVDDLIFPSEAVLPAIIDGRGP